MEMNREIFEQIINISQDCVFWKDTERRFAGANQAFLDFYGFPSVNVILGKNDEDMGWHSDSEPYRKDELRVLQGESTHKVQGKCLIRGEERDIIASKCPLYSDGKIVGLLGSFIDVTDVMEKANGAGKNQVMYSRDELRQYPFFDRLLDDVGLDELLDSLTGIISREYILRFARSLITSGTPFTFSIVDLDNFKFINDTYGHQVGDQVLADIAKEMSAYTRGYGVVGRFGGDELLIINLRDLGYDEKKGFFEPIYESGHILRKNLVLENGSPYITATCGCATFPDDAQRYEELFALIDKTLYRGKRKGRNCYIIYVEEKHKDLEMSKLAGQGVYTGMHRMVLEAQKEEGLENKLRSVSLELKDELQISDLYLIGRSGSLKAILSGDVGAQGLDMSTITADGLYVANNLNRIEKEVPELYRFMKERDMRTAILVPIGQGEGKKACLLCAAPGSYRIWQENECALLYFLASFLDGYISSGEDDRYFE